MEPTTFRESWLLNRYVGVVKDCVDAREEVPAEVMPGVLWTALPESTKERLESKMVDMTGDMYASVARTAETQFNAMWDSVPKFLGLNLITARLQWVVLNLESVVGAYVAGKKGCKSSSF